MASSVTHNQAAQRFEIGIGGALATCHYRRSGSLLVLHHTEVPPAEQGQGVAATLVAAALAWAREEGLQVRPTCSYVASYMRRHPETQDLLEAPIATARDVLAFWFGEPAASAPRPAWFRKDEAFDALIRQRFGSTLEAALTGGLRHWDATPPGALARIVVLDQFTRNSYRDTPRAFAGDALALAAAMALVATGGDRELLPLQRWFAYLPFEHAEDLGLQQRALQLFGALAQEHPALADTVVWAQKHLDVVARFGRFPHRNGILGRVSTAEEEAFLALPGSRF
jgi:uncharacterized protein (DUF924 family)/predicted GNAT family acetyltransferase